MKVSFVAGVSPVVTSARESMAFYGEALGVPFDNPDADYPMTVALAGVEHFSLWGLKECAQACFGTDHWPEDRVVPQANIEFDVESAEAVTEAADELTARGYTLLVAPKTEPWGQTVTRLQTPEGLLIGVTFTPWMHQGDAE
jgi:catechol 2,3-dioxygenase-like lactoylglutathione lyase family enzyme